MSLIASALFILLGCPPAAAQESMDLAELLNSSELRDYQRKQKYRDRMDLFRKVLERYSREITAETKAKAADQAGETLLKIQAVCRLAREESDATVNTKDYRSKQVRRLEIRLRKLVEILDDLKNAFPFEHRGEFEETANDLEQLRNFLLARFFGKSISSEAALMDPFAASPRKKAVGSGLPKWLAAIASGGLARFSPVLPGLSAEPQRRARDSGIVGDQFTEKELDDLREAQDLKKRVEVFLKIAESRLDEIDRRREHLEWDKKEPNPLEFYTYGQLLHAYSRSLDGTMVNIDEKARYKTASEKDIRKSLEMVNEQVLKFIPRLEPLLQMAIDLQDEEFFLEARHAMAKSDIARKGSQLGLGAPVH